MISRLRILCFAAFAALPTQAIDLTGSGMSTVWQKLYGIVPGQLGNNAGDDLDGDGYTNLQESMFGTNPRDPNSRLSIRLAPPPNAGELDLRLNTQLGKLYEIDASTDLQTWYFVGQVTGDGTVQDFITTASTSPQTFFRAKYAGDLPGIQVGFTAWEENQIALSPSTSNTLDTGSSASVAIPDLWAALYGFNPNDPNLASEMAPSGDMTLGQKFAAHLDPTTNDTDKDGVVDLFDVYPNDPQRSQDMPSIQYAAIDLSTAVAGQVNVSDVALDDSDAVAFLYQTGTGANDHAYSYTWAAGVTSQGVTAPMQKTGAYSTNYYYSFAFVNSRGYAAGSDVHYTTDPNGSSGTETVVATSSGGSSAVDTNPITDISDIPFGYSKDGTVWGEVTGVRDFINGTHFDFYTSNQFKPLFVASQLLALGQRPDGTIALWNGTGSSTSPMLPASYAGHVTAFNASSQVFGYSAQVPQTVLTPFLPQGAVHPFFLTTANQPIDFYTLIPTVFKDQVAFFDTNVGYSATAALNSNGELMTNGQTWNEATGSDTPEWLQSYFLWQPAAGQTPSQLSIVNFPPNFHFYDFNTDHWAVGTLNQPVLDGNGKPTYDGSGNPITSARAALCIPAQFALRNNGSVAQGWDSTGVFAPKKQSNDYTPWTMVPVGGTNNLVKLTLPNNAQKLGLELVVDPASSAYISIANNQITGQETDFSISGIATNDGMRENGPFGGPPLPPWQTGLMYPSVAGNPWIRQADWIAANNSVANE